MITIFIPYCALLGNLQIFEKQGVRIIISSSAERNYFLTGMKKSQFWDSTKM